MTEITLRSTVAHAGTRRRRATRSTNARVAQYVRDLSTRDAALRRTREQYLDQPGAIRLGG